MATLFIPLAVCWSLLYWVIGGVLFSIVAVLRVGRIRRARFGCFFSASAVGAGVLAAWAGLKISETAIATCSLSDADRIGSLIEQFACGIIGIVGSFFGGFLLLMFAGVGIMMLSKATNECWIENDGPKDDHTGHSHSHDHGHDHHH